MKHLEHLIESLSDHLQKNTGFAGAAQVLAKRWNTDQGAIYVSKTGEKLLPSNECELSGFHYFPNYQPIFDTEYGCKENIIGWQSRGFAILYGKSECGFPETDKIAKCISRFSYTQNGITASIRPTNIVQDMPNIISQHFASIKNDFQTAQPCTSLFKIEYEINIDIAFQALSYEDNTPPLSASTITAATSNAIQLDGFGQFVDIPNYSIATSADFTIEGLMYFPLGSGITNYDGLFRTTVGKGGVNFFDSTPRVFFGTDVLVSSAPVSEDTWHHIAITRESDLLKIFVDGIKTGEVASWSDSFVIASFGQGSTSAGETNASLDNLRIWSIARSEADILAAKHAEILTSTGLERSYNFENVVGTNLPDDANSQDAAIGGSGTPTIIQYSI